MLRSFLEERERGLENEYFHRVDLELWRRLRNEVDVERRVDGLRRTTGIQDSQVLHELAELDIGEESLLALSLYPLVRVAWAGDRIDRRQREAVLRAAQGIGCEHGTAGYQLLEEWLQRPPDEAVHRAWRDYLHAVLQSSSPYVKSVVKRDILARARSVAEADGGLLGFHRVSAAESAAMRELAQEFDAA